MERHETIDEGKRTRHETRIVEVFDAAGHLRKTQWNGLISRIVRVTRVTLSRRAKDGLWDASEDVSFYASTAPLGAQKAATAIRSHWAIENRSHYVRDVCMREDQSRIRCNPGIFARARSFALNILRANGQTNIADALWKNALDLNRTLQYRSM